jgi:hypothetical protein
MKEKMFKYLCQKESKYLRLKRQKMNKDMFELIRCIGIGAFGKVSLVRKVCVFSLQSKIYRLPERYSRSLCNEDVVQRGYYSEAASGACQGGARHSSRGKQRVGRKVSIYTLQDNQNE